MQNIEIKYLVKNKQTGVIETLFFYLSEIEIGGFDRLLNFKEYEVIDRLRFTGLSDKNGKKIFEKDSVKFDDKKVSQVIFEDGAFFFSQRRIRLHQTMCAFIEIV